MSMSAAAFGPASSAAPAVPTTRGARHADATGVNEAAAFAGALAAALGWPALPAPIADRPAGTLDDAAIDGAAPEHGSHAPDGLFEAATGADTGMLVEAYAADEAGARGEAKLAGMAALTPNRDIERLDPAFRERLERVIERMREEYGHEVRLVEGVRTWERQELLFRQGRDRPGPVVTWTRNSRHLHGLAADLLVDGTYDHPVGYARLAQIAREEGLRTLGPRDAGHVEFVPDAEVAEPVRATTAPEAPRVIEAADAADSDAEVVALRVARVAEVAEVARPVVARVAAVAPVARVAAVGAPTGSTEEGEAVAPGGEAAGDGGDVGAAGVPRTETPVAPTSAESAAPAEGSAAEAAARVARVLETHEALRQTQPLSRVFLRLDDHDGGAGSIRIDLRGNAVEASIALDDALDAARLNARIDELAESLRQQGLRPELLGARHATSAADALETLRAMPGLAEAEAALTHLARHEAGREAGDERAFRHPHDASHRDEDANRHRSRREHDREDAR